MKSLFCSGLVVLFLFNVAAADEPSIRGDFSLDEQLNAADIDMLTRVVVAGDSWFDLNHDRVVDGADRLVLLEELMNHTFTGDANLDGEYNSGDLVAIFSAGEYEDAVSMNSTWATGDFNGDGEFDTSDFVISFQGGWYESGPRPECAPFCPPHLPPATPGTPRWFGDLNLDQQLSGEDIDLLSIAIREGSDNRAHELFRERGFDLSGDNHIDQNDRDVWIVEIKRTFRGDSNLDGEFNSGDFVTAFQGGEYEDAILRNSTWTEGDWNGDLEFDSADFVHVFAPSEGGFEVGPRFGQRAVPEPHGLVLLVMAAIGPLLQIRGGQIKRGTEP